MTDDLLFKELTERLDRIEKNIKSDFPNWLSVRQVADYLSLSSSTIRKLISTGQIPYKRLPLAESGAIRFNRRLIDLWLLSGEVKPTARARQTFAEFVDD